MRSSCPSVVMREQLRGGIPVPPIQPAAASRARPRLRESSKQKYRNEDAHGTLLQSLISGTSLRERSSCIASFVAFHQVAQRADFQPPPRMTTVPMFAT